MKLLTIRASSVAAIALLILLSYTPPNNGGPSRSGGTGTRYTAGLQQ
ncbi:MAG: hypothetical protein KME27_23135 [Lyngbya sp. HA4199-MV5]|nr:hypothetical protein [Lyngbya sp. HA4199-MV5]